MTIASTVASGATPAEGYEQRRSPKRSNEEVNVNNERLPLRPRVMLCSELEEKEKEEEETGHYKGAL